MLFGIVTWFCGNGTLAQKAVSEEKLTAAEQQQLEAEENPWPRSARF